jgi:hypothetical protein
LKLKIGEGSGGEVGGEEEMLKRITATVTRVSDVIVGYVVYIITILKL